MADLFLKRLGIGLGTAKSRKDEGEGEGEDSHYAGEEVSEDTNDREVRVRVVPHFLVRLHIPLKVFNLGVSFVHF